MTASDSTAASQAADSHAVDTPAAGTAAAAGWRRTAALLAMAAVVVSALTFLAMRPAMTNCGTTIMGGPGDATAGGVWLAWQYSVEDGPPWDGHTDVTAAPEGEDFWLPHFTTALTLFGTEWALAQVVSPVCAWNLTVFLGFVLTGLAVFALVHWLTRNVPAAAFAMFAFTFSPYRFGKMQGHLAYVHAEVIVLVLLTGFLLWQRPTWARAAVAGATLALCGYTDGYFILLGGVTFAAFHLAALAYATVVERWRGRSARQTVTRLAAACVVAVVLMVPLAVTLLTQRGEIAAQTARSRESLHVYSARVHEYLLPSPLHPVWDEWVAPYRSARIHGSNLSEQNLYLGVVVMAMAASAVVVWARSRRNREEPVAAGLSFGFVGWVLGAVAAVALVFSAPPEFDVLGVDVPTPSNIVFSLFSSWRVYARFFIVVHAALVVLAALFVARTLARRRPGVQAAAVLALVAVTAFDHLPFPPPGQWNRNASPEVYFYLACRPERVMAEYPMLPTEADPDHKYLTYQPVHGKAMVNVRNAPSEQDAITRTLAGPGDEGTLNVLRAYGVGLVVVHPGPMFGRDTPPPAPPGLRLLRTFRYSDPPANPARKRVVEQAHFYDAAVYTVEPGPKARVAVAQERNFYPPETAGWQGFSWMDTKGQIRLVALEPGATRASVRVTATSYKEPREVRVVQNGVELFRGMVGEQTEVSFTADVGPPIEVIATPGARFATEYDPASTDTRVLAVALGNFVATPV